MQSGYAAPAFAAAGWPNGSGVAALPGYCVFPKFSADVIATTAIAADTMIPEAFEEAHDFAGFITVAGFLAAFVLTELQT